MFSCSIAENIAYGADDPASVTAVQVERVADVANATAFIRSFPHGFSTVVGEKGVLLSGARRLPPTGVPMSTRACGLIPASAPRGFAAPRPPKPLSRGDSTPASLASAPGFAATVPWSCTQRGSVFPTRGKVCFAT